MKAIAFLSAFVLVSVAFANEDGSVTFDFSKNDGCYTITSSSGAKFTTKWSSCHYNKIWAYGYEVKRVGFGTSLTSLPADPFAFTELDWGLDVMSVPTGGCVVFMNSSDQFLCAHVTKIKTRQFDGVSADTISFDYRIYDDAQTTVDVVKEKLELAKQNYRAVGSDSGSATFHYEYNDNVFTVEGATGQYFELEMGSCNDYSMYVYDFHVEAIASASSWSSFPSSTSAFSSLNWLYSIGMEFMSMVLPSSISLSLFVFPFRPRSLEYGRVNDCAPALNVSRASPKNMRLESFIPNKFSKNDRNSPYFAYICRIIKFKEYEKVYFNPCRRRILDGSCIILYQRRIWYL